MSLIRVNPPELRSVAHEIEEVAQGYLSLAKRALRATQDAPSYNSQFGPQVRASGDEAHARLSTYAGRLSELSQNLAQISGAFERADLDTLMGLQALGSSIQALSEASLANPLLRLFLGEMRPPNFSEERWAMLPMEDRLAIFGSLQGSLAFIVGASTVEGVELYVRKPLKIRRDPGMEGDVLAYAEPGSTVIWSGEKHEITTEINGEIYTTVWYAVTYVHPIMGLVTGWVSSKYLKDGEYRVGYGPETVAQNFTIQENREVMESGGNLMAVTSDWLVILDGPTWEYGKAVDPVEWGGVVRWTGRSIEEGGHTWYEVTCWKEGEDGTLEAVTGWARGDRVMDYEPPPGVPTPQEGNIYIPLKDQWNASYYTVTDVDAYAAVQHNGEGFDRLVPIPWREGFQPVGIEANIEVPHGSLFSHEGVAMEGSGKKLLESGEMLFFELDNPLDLEWKDAGGREVWWETDRGWVNSEGPSFPVEIANPDAAEFRSGSKATQLTSGISVAAPEKLRGSTLYIPELAPFTEDGLGVFEVVDTGGAYGPGELRIDVFYDSFDAGRTWHNDTYLARIKGLTVYVEQPIPPELGQTPSP